MDALITHIIIFSSFAFVNYFLSKLTPDKAFERTYFQGIAILMCLFWS